MLRRITIAGYRSLVRLDLRLNQLTIISGPNGVGKTNFYNALRLVCMAARGQFAGTLVEEGGMPSALWAGETKRGPRQIEIQIEFDDFTYRLAAGLPPPSDIQNHNDPNYSFFQLDPVVREEQIWSGNPHRGGTCLMERKNGAVFIRNDSGRMLSQGANFDDTESALPQLRDPQQYPELFLIRERLSNWRFYHQFDTGPRAPQRWPQAATRTPILADDGRNLAAAFRTIEEIGQRETLHAVLGTAFPDSRFEVVDAGGTRLMMQMRGTIQRPFAANELSDGTLRFLCLATALLSPRPADFVVLNEPEASLNANLLPGLTDLVRAATRHAQIWITTHDPEFARQLAGIDGATAVVLANQDGRTVIVGQRAFDAVEE